MGLIGNIREEIRIIRERDPAIHSSLEVFLYPSFKVRFPSAAQEKPESRFIRAHRSEKDFSSTMETG